MSAPQYQQRPFHRRCSFRHYGKFHRKPRWKAVDVSRIDLPRGLGFLHPQPGRRCVLPDGSAREPLPGRRCSHSGQTLECCNHAEEFAVKFEIGIVVAAAVLLAGCTIESKTVEQSAEPTAGGKILTFEVRSMSDFDAAKSKAESVCRSQYGAPAHYVDRVPGPTGDTVRFECTD
jgi:hypothetical protein